MTLDEVKKTFSGAIITPGDSNYDQASAILIRKGSPAIVFACATPQDVVLALSYARATDLIVSVRSGGHSNAGLSTNDGGVIIDVTLLNSVEVLDKQTGRVRIGAGAKWFDAAKALEEYGLAISSGDTRTVGVSGLTLGGGIGWMVRKYGLTIDSLLSAQLVLANGEILEVSAESYPDLFWAVRGGGGNFGVATSFEFSAHQVSDVFFGNIVYPLVDAEAQLMAWRDYMRTASEDLTTSAFLTPVMGPEAPAMFIVAACWAGDVADADAALGPLRRLPGKPVSDTVKQEPYYAVLEEAKVPQGMHIEVNNAFFQSLTDEVINKLAAAKRDHNLMFQVRYLGGAMNRVAPNAAAFGHRDSEVMVLSPLILPGGTSEEAIQAALEPWYDIAKDSKGAYVNFFSRNEDRTVQAAYLPETLKRLEQIKAKYDPQNIFNQNLNIKPVKE
ncbi:MAG TPA: FAD-binding oxidoreductase [Candidatus Saccharimonadia bacterium]|nr:FAD-binding oxidoreductase [Candidatus Saccharimonadia bacterium]